MKELELFRIRLLKTLVELEEYLIADSEKDNYYLQAVIGESQLGNFVERQNGQGKKVLSVAELSDYLGVSPDCIYTMVRENQIPHIRIRRRILFYRESIDSWLQSNTIKA